MLPSAVTRVHTRPDGRRLAPPGACDAATVIIARATGQSRGFGFVDMGSDDAAHQAIQQFDGHELKGRQITVSEAHRRKGGGGGRVSGGGRGRRE